MGKTIAEKIIDAHLVEGEAKAGNVVKIKIDQTLTQDATGTMAYLQFEALELDRVKNKLAVSYVDHNTIQVGFENADDHKYLQSLAAKKGVVFSRPGNGICHQTHLERFGVPGETLLGADSHTPTGGGIGMLAIGAGGLDVALAMAGESFSIIYPKIIGIKLTGHLRPYVAAKDVILKVLERFTVKGNVNTVFEYFGDGVKTLSVPERSTICNMGAECGVTTSVFPSDEVTKQFLEAQGRAGDYSPLESDIDAIYDLVYEIDLSTLEPLAACPHSPGNIQTVKALEGMKIDQVLIGSCTNSSYADMVKVAQILDGHVVAPNVSLGIAPGSREVLMMIAADGTLEKLVKAGARILESACGFCIGNHQSPPTNGVSLRTNNRNFEGRSGTKSGQVYLVSPETAALSAIKGYFAYAFNEEDRAELKSPKVERFITDDSMLIFPPSDGSAIQIQRGPNIGQAPKSEALSNNLEGEVAIKVGDKITTDHIMPAGSRLKYRSNTPVYASFVFEGVDPTFSERTLALKEKGKASFIVAGYSYGQGSSREHAAICPMYLGVKAVLALSIERIHQANLCNFGILPLTFKSEDDYRELGERDKLEIKNAREQVMASLEGKDFLVYDATRSKTIHMNLNITKDQADMLIKGGRLNQVKGV